MTNWLYEIKKELKVNVLQKYMWIYERLETIERQLKQSNDNVSKIYLFNQKYERTEENYPKASLPARQAIQTEILKRVDNNDAKYLCQANYVE